MNAEAVVVSLAVAAIRPLRGCGALKAQADVVINIDERFEFTVCGIQVRPHGGRWLVQSPAYRCGASGLWKPAILLPEEVTATIGREVCDAMAVPA